MSAIFQNRRGFLRHAAAGFGYTAFAGLAALESLGAKGSQNPLLPKAPHFEPKAKRVIFLFMQGGPDPARHVRLQPQCGQVCRQAIGDGTFDWHAGRQDFGAGL